MGTVVANGQISLNGKNEVEIRCPGRHHARIVDGLLEIPCRYCRSDPGEVVYHYYNLQTGELLRTRRFQSARKLGKRE
jgi:hypothetical protein